MATSVPWYRRTWRWGQTNLTEVDPLRYDRSWWREHWRRTHVQGVVVNAGGFVSYYPSDVPGHRPAEHLGGRDLFGEVVEDARQEGLTVLARMDSHRASAQLYEAHPDWFAHQLDGTPYRVAGAHITSPCGPYYTEHLPAILREVAQRYAPDGFADNSWAGPHRGQISYDVHSASAFRADTGQALPPAADWDDPVYRTWIRWGYEQRTRLWRRNDAVTRAAGGEHCRWLGMVGGEVENQCHRLVDARAVLSGSPVALVDHQCRTRDGGFAQNAEVGHRVHELVGWDALVPESTAMYSLGPPAFRLSAMPEAEVVQWAASGIAGGLQPWWHHVGAVHDDRRQHASAAPLFSWHERYEEYLRDREPLAEVGVVWSPTNTDFFGRDRAADRTAAPYRGVHAAVRRAALPGLPVHVEDVDRAVGRVSVLVLPEVAAMSLDQAQAVRRFLDAGGSLLATGRTSLYDEDGARRSDFALGDVLGVRSLGRATGGDDPRDPSLEDARRHTYLRFAGGDDVMSAAVRQGLEQTSLLAFGGRLEEVEVLRGTHVALTAVPALPVYPPETAWLRRSHSDVPAMAVRAHPGGGRVAYLAADLDRSAGREGVVDHLALLGNVVRWLLGRPPRVQVSGGGGLDVHVFRQGGRLVVHLVNVLATSSTPGQHDAVVPLGPLDLRLRWDEPLRARARLLVAGTSAPVRREDDALVVHVPRVAAHEVVVVGED